MNGPRIFKNLGRVFSAVGLVEMLACAAIALATGEWFSLVFMIHGAIFLLAGGLLLGFSQRSKRKRARLLAEGLPIQAQVVDLVYDGSVRVNRRGSYRLLCRYEEGGNVYQYRSHRLWQRPELISDTVTIYRNPQKPKDYYVDVDGITRPIIEL